MGGGSGGGGGAQGDGGGNSWWRRRATAAAAQRAQSRLQAGASSLWGVRARGGVGSSGNAARAQAARETREGPHVDPLGGVMGAAGVHEELISALPPQPLRPARWARQGRSALAGLQAQRCPHFCDLCVAGAAMLGGGAGPGSWGHAQLARYSTTGATAAPHQRMGGQAAHARPGRASGILHCNCTLWGARAAGWRWHDARRHTMMQRRKCRPTDRMPALPPAAGCVPCIPPLQHHVPSPTLSF